MVTLDNPVYVLFMLALMVLLGVLAEKTKWGKQLGAAL